MGLLETLKNRIVNKGIKTTALAVAAPALALAPRPAATPKAELQLKERQRRDERLQFCRLVTAELPKGLSQREAADKVAARDAHLFPELLHAGKHGKSALTYQNFINWTRKLGKRRSTGEYNWDNGHKLAVNWASGSHAAPGSEHFRKVFFALYMNLNALDVTDAYRRACKWLKKHKPDEEIPELHQIYYMIKKLPKSSIELARRGESYYDAHYLNYIDRDPDSIRANEAWVADTRMLDIWIKVPDGKGGWLPDPVRPYMIVILDVKTLFAVAFVLTPYAPGNADIRNALGCAVKKFGRAEYWYSDNGSDYTARGFTTPVIFTPKIANSEQYAHSIMIELAIQVKFAKAYNARAKVVERFNKEVAKKHDKGFGSYLGCKPGDRPETAAALSKPQNIHLLPTIGEVAIECDQFLHDYHNTPGNGKFLNGMTPAQAFAPEHRHTRPPLTDPELYMAFLKPMNTPRKVDKRGPSIHLGKLRYVAVDRDLLDLYADQQVMVKFDNLDSGHCFAFELSGKFICECRTPEFLAYFAETGEQKLKLSAAEKENHAQKKRCKALVHSLTGGFERLEPRSMPLLTPAMLDAGTRLQIVARHQSVKGVEHDHRIYDLPATLTEKAIPQDYQAAPESSDHADRLKFQHEVDDVLLGTPEEAEPIKEFVLEEGIL